jgi:alpha/beta superfamily hydrolase
MRSIVIGALFEALPAAGATTLRFNFRGVERSTGTFGGGTGERDDARAALTAVRAELPPEAPIVLVGWSFGADVALSILDPEVAAWVAIAPPLRLVADLDALAQDPRPKLLALAEHDEVCSVETAQQTAAGWQHATVEVVPGASHFFVGRTDRLTALVTGYVAGLGAS